MESRKVNSKKISVGFVYRVLPSYRLAIMEELSKLEDIDLLVYYSKEPPYYSLKSVDPKNLFKNKQIQMKAWKILGQEFLFQPELKEIIESKKHDVLVLPGNPRVISNLLGIRHAKINSTPIVWWSLGVMPNQSSVTLWLRKLLMINLQSLVFYTNDERKYYESKGIDPNKIFVAQNTISVNKEMTAVKQWTDERIKHFKKDNGLQDKKVFLFCGQLREKKRLDWLFEAFKKIISCDDSYHLCIIGPGDKRGQYEQEICCGNLSRHIRFLGPIYETDALAPWFLSARALVVPRAIGLASFHGFAFGLPCITSSNRRYQTPEATALIDNYNSLLFQDGNIQSLIDTIRLLGEDDMLQYKLSENAKKTMCEEFTTQKMVEGFHQAIKYAYSCVYQKQR